jgi:hypothetical protein
LSRSLDIAGLVVLVDFPGQTLPLPGHYTDSINHKEPDVIVEFEVDPALRDRPKTDGFPGFHSKQESTSRIGLSRSDAEGTIDLNPGQPVHARFRIGPKEMAMEAILRISAGFGLAQHQGLILHSSAIQTQNGRAHMFSEPCSVVHFRCSF